MKTILFSIVVSMVIFCANAQNFKPLSFEEADKKADSILRLMTLKEKIDYIGGSNFFYTQEIERLGISSISFADATQGVRLNPGIINKGMKKLVEKTVAYPAPILLASTWNKALSYEYANNIGKECNAAGIPVLLGPGFNLYRNSQCGRNFEYFGEDPFLAGNLIKAYVTGLQATGTIATLKHFLANQTDFFRKRSNSVVDERTLHEIYMPAFKYGIDAGARAVMTSYNLVNGEWAGQSNYVINQLLRTDLGFNWLVMTDWISVWDGEKLIKSGQDLEMPYRSATKHADKLLKTGKITEAEIDRMVKSILRTFISMNSFQVQKKPLTDTDYNKFKETALNTAREGIVLLRNSNKLLPIDKSKNLRILVTGEYLDEFISGKGAAHVKGFDHILLKEAIKSEFGNQAIFVKKPTEAQLKSADVVILNVGTHDAEAADRPFDLPEDQEKLVQFCSTHNANTVVIVTSGSGINMSAWNKVNAILYTWYLGQNGAQAVAEILSGTTNPSGKLPISIEKSFNDSPAFGYIPPGEKLYSGLNLSSQKINKTYDIKYNEGIFMGYRWYESKKIEPQFPFGFGLSYTTFEYSNLSISNEQIAPDQTLELTLIVKNTGDCKGSETVQLYVSDLKSSVPRPIKELKGFEKVRLNVGESKEVTFVLNPNDFAFWHPETKKWTVEEGELELLIGASSTDIRLKKTVFIKK